MSHQTDLAETVSGGVAHQEVEEKDTLTGDGRAEPRKEPNGKGGDAEHRVNI